MAERLTTVADAMTPQPLSVAPDTPVKTLVKLMSDRHIGGLPVVEAGRVVGVVSESDLLFRESRLHPPRLVSLLDAIIPIDGLRRLEEELRRATGATARDLMSSPALTTRPEASLESAATLMVEQDVDRLPVVSETGELVGMLTRHDIVRALADRE